MNKEAFELKQAENGDWIIYEHGQELENWEKQHAVAKTLCGLYNEKDLYENYLDEASQKLSQAQASMMGVVGVLGGIERSIEYISQGYYVPEKTNE